MFGKKKKLNLSIVLDEERRGASIGMMQSKIKTEKAGPNAN